MHANDVFAVIFLCWSEAAVADALVTNYKEEKKRRFATNKKKCASLLHIDVLGYCSVLFAAHDKIIDNILVQLEWNLWLDKFDVVLMI